MALYDQALDLIPRDDADRRRDVQLAYNQEHGITPQTIQKAIAMPWAEAAEADYVDVPIVAEEAETYASPAEIAKRVTALQKEMRDAASRLEFERAAELRDRIQHLQEQELALRGG